MCEHNEKGVVPIYMYTNVLQLSNVLLTIIHHIMVCISIFQSISCTFYPEKCYILDMQLILQCEEKVALLLISHVHGTGNMDGTYTL